MFNVTSKYIAASHSPSRETDIRGQIILSNGRIVEFTSRDLLQGSTTYSNSCLNTSTFTLGSCYIGEFKTTIKTTVDRYALFGGTIIVEYVLKVDEGTWEVVPVGTFTINSARRVGNYVEIDSFDNMSLLEASVGVGTSGTAEDLVSWICQECHIDSGMTPEMWGNLVNTDFVFAFSDGDYDTYRDVLSDVATMLGGFATIDRFGGLVILPFGAAAIDSVDDNIRTSSKFEDYVCKYTAASIKIKGTPYSHAEETDDGLTMILHDSKLAGANSPEQIEEMLVNIVTRIKDIEYVPCEIDMMINPAYDLGDVIEFTGYNTGGASIYSQIHSISWTFRSSMKISSVGENAKIANSKSASEKVVDSVGSIRDQVELKTIQFTNARAYEIAGGKRTTILDAQFSATYNENAIPLLSGQFVANVEEPGIYRLIYELNGIEYDFKPEDTIYHTGTKTFTFIKSFDELEVDVGNRLKIYMECDPVIIKSHDLVKDQTTGEYSLTEVETTYNGKASIAVNHFNAILQSANLSFAIKWDGNFEIADEYMPIDFKRCTEVVYGQTTEQLLMVDVDEYRASATATCLHRPATVINPTIDMQAIMDYDAVPYYDLPYVQIANASSDTGSLGLKSIVINHETGVASCCAPYYMQLEEGESTRITVTSESSVKLYLIDHLTEEIYNVAIEGENNIIEYTSIGARFWILIISDNRREDGTYTIITERI